MYGYFSQLQTYVSVRNKSKSIKKNKLRMPFYFDFYHSYLNIRMLKFFLHKNDLKMIQKFL